MTINTFKTLSLISLLSISTLTHAMTDTELTSKLRAEADKYTVSFKQPKMFFHWVDASDITPKGQYNGVFDSNNPMFAAYVQKNGGYIARQRSPKDDDIAGPGLYMAADPLVSRSYGGEKTYGLITGVINPKAKLIALEYNQTGELPNDVINELKARGCSDENLLNLLDTKDKACTKIKQLLLGKGKLYLDGRIYSWSTNGNYLPGCKFNNQMNDLILGAKADPTNNMDTLVAYTTDLFTEIHGFTHKTKPTSSDPNGNLILSYLKTNNGIAGNQLLSAEQLKDASIKTLSKSENETFTKKFIWGCK